MYIVDRGATLHMMGFSSPTGGLGQTGKSPHEGAWRFPMDTFG